MRSTVLPALLLMLTFPAWAQHPVPHMRPLANQGHIPPPPPMPSRNQVEHFEGGRINSTPHVNHDTWYGHELSNDPRFHLAPILFRMGAFRTPARASATTLSGSIRSITGSGFRVASISKSRPGTGPSVLTGAGTAAMTLSSTRTPIIPAGTCFTTFTREPTSTFSTWAFEAFAGLVMLRALYGPPLRETP